MPTSHARSLPSDRKPRYTRVLCVDNAPNPVEGGHPCCSIVVHHATICSQSAEKGRVELRRHV